ncbi:MAG: hypothetical protein AAGC78_03160 [Cellvibrio sp.]|uniref:InlB B-repeat-containing protein n=1 Tax=Cellvibrio sp. TaxID=1965322 RepID=UPI0031B45873
MNSSHTISRWLLLNTTLGFALALSACGGGGGGNSSGGGTTSAASTIYSVNATAGQGGSISPASRTVTSGQTTTFTLTANSGYHIEGASGCNGSLVGNLYTTGSVTGNCTITANFAAQPTHPVAIKQNAGGSVSPTSASVVEGTTGRFTITPDTGYRIASATGCGGALDGNIFTTSPVTAACSVDISFEQQQLVINTELVGSGSISPRKITSLYGMDLYFFQGNGAYFFPIPTPGYAVSKVSGCGAIWTKDALMINDLTADCTLRVEFTVVDYEISTLIKGDGAVTPTSITARYGDEVHFKITPGSGNKYSFSQGCEGYFDSQDNEFVIPSVTSSCQLQLSFNDTQHVYFADPKLEQKVRAELSITHDQPLLPTDLEKLQQLDATQTNIQWLDGLEYAKNLKSLHITSNHITNLRPLATLQIEYLYLSQNPITNEQLAFLSKMPLRTLALDRTQVTDITPLANNKQLEYLSIGFSLIQDLSPLQSLANLTTLNAANSSVTDITPLLSQGLAKLSSVGLGGCLKTRGFSRALPVVDALKKKGVSVELIAPNSWPEKECPPNDLIDEVILSGKVQDGELELNWQIPSTDQGPWLCELHFNLDSQLPRLPAKVIENCHTQTSIRLAGYNLHEYAPFLVVDTGIYKARKTSAPITVTTTNKPQTAFLQSYDWAQTIIKTNPLLVAGKVGTLRLHVNAPTATPIPELQVFAELDDQREAVPVTPPTSIPTAKQHDKRNQSFYSHIPARLMQPGVKIEVVLAGTSQLQLHPQFAKVKGINLRLIPFQLNGLVTALPTDELVRDSLTRFWPLGEIQISRRAPYQLSQTVGQNTTTSMLNELADLRAIENGTGYYYGYFDQSFTSGWFDGRGFTQGMVAVGVSRSVVLDTVLAHELGHNFSVNHAPCGDAGSADADFPYTNGAIGSYGTDQDYTTIFTPELKDLMGYCGGDHVSDYNYEKAQDYLDSLVGQPHVINTAHAAISARKSSTATNAHSSLYLRIAVTGTGAQIVQQIALPHLPKLQASNTHRAQVDFADGSQRDLPVTFLQFDHDASPGEYQLQLAIPTDEQQPTRLILLENKKILLEHKFASNTIKNKTTTTQSKVNVMSRSTAQHQLHYRNNEICVDLSSSARHTNLLWHHTDGVIALALNETAQHFCRSINDLPAGEAELQVF